METRCTCGAVLPEAARFCHKCGKPQYEEDVARLSNEEAVPVQGPLDVPAATTAPARIGFGNLRAVVTTMAVAALALILLFAAVVVYPPLGLVVIAGAGYLAAHLYSRQSTQPLSPGGGAYLGLMTGLWLFLVFAFCAAIVSVEVSSVTGREMLRAGMARVPDSAKLLDDPHQFLMAISGSLIAMFFLATVSAAFGGLIAGRMSTRSRHT